MDTTRHEPQDTSDWKSLYEAVLVEADVHKLQSRIDEAQQAILDRAEELPNQPFDEEHQALRNAMAVLQALQRVAPITSGSLQPRTAANFRGTESPGNSS
jgi:hypothetical protein